jgi:hypothetical protein
MVEADLSSSSSSSSSSDIDELKKGDRVKASFLSFLAFH